jgi:hypothetical protein
MGGDPAQVPSCLTCVPVAFCRQRIGEQNARIQGLAKQAQEKLKLMSTERAAMSEQQSAKARKLMQDFGAVLQVGRPLAGAHALQMQWQRAACVECTLAWKRCLL